MDKNIYSMSSMEVILLILVFHLGGLCETEAVSVTGEVGKAITITCSHGNAYSNVKYFCKGACGDKDVLITSRNKKDTNGKYAIRDKGNTFTVTISRLTEDDSGTYWCGIERVGFDTYNEVILTVIQVEDPDDDFDLQLSNLTSSSRKLVYIGAGLGVVVLALAGLILLFLRRRRRNIRTSSEKVQDTDCATPFCQKQNAHHVPASSSKDEERDGNANSNFSMMSVQHQDTSKDDAGNIYSNVTVSAESQVKPHGLLYSTVSFNKHPDCSAVKPCATAVTYSTLNDISTDESTVYSNL